MAVRVAAMAFAIVLITTPATAHAQVPYRSLDANTQVRSLSFSFPDGRTFPVARLQETIAVSAMGRAPGLRRRLAFLPLISAPGRHTFSPLELQRDVARLRRFYAANGFLEPDISYEVSLDEERNVVDIVLVVREGRPLELAGLTFRMRDTTQARGSTRPPADSAIAFPDELQPAWDRFQNDQQRELGKRVGESERTTIQSRALNWMMDRGYAFARTRSFLRVDTAAARAEMTVVMNPGPRARVDSLAIEGNQQVADNVLRKTMPLREGDWFSGSKLAEGQRRVFGLDLFRLSLVDVPEQPRDSSVTVRLRVEENPPRLIAAETGYSSEAGFTTRGQWAHRNFLGGARTLQVNAIAQTGIQAFDENPDRRYQLGFNFTQPAFFDPRLTLGVRPFAEYRDVLIDRSWEAGIETSLVYELGVHRYVSFQHRLSSRRVLDYNLTAGGAIDLFTLRALTQSGALDDIATRVDRSIFALAGTIGRYDPTAPARTLQARPSLEITAPANMNTIEWARADVTIVGHMPLGERMGLDGRAQLGRMALFGSSRVGDDDPLTESLNAILLREVLFTAGGTGSVRGWGQRMLGPKWPDLRFFDVGTDTSRAEASSYLPFGGLSRVLGSVELRLPFPGLGPTWGTHVFLDGARIGNFAGTLQPEGSEDERGTFFGTGAGIDVATPVGPLRLSLGYKLNPSPFDLRRPADVLEALLDERPIDTVPTRRLQRFHLHLSIGQSF